VFVSKGSKTKIIKNNKTKIIDKTITDLVRENQYMYNQKHTNDLPPFSGGVVGYLSYESIRWYEDIHTHKNKMIPDSIFMLFKDVIAFDHINGDAIVISNVKINNDTSPDIQYKNAIDRIDQIGELMHNRFEYRQNPERNSYSQKSNFTKSEFKKAVQKAKSYIRSGDIFQVVLSQKFERKTNTNSTNLYRSLRRINPSPYLFHLKFDEFDIIGSSPEMMVNVNQEVVNIRPIAGTRKRGVNDKEDALLSEDLLADEKERAEHLMLVDLGRNDVGKVSQIGSVKVTEFMSIEKYSHVMHIVSNVVGKLSSSHDNFDALMSGFPAGTVTGAPKIRAMNIINELEKEPRGIYSGSVGFFDFKNNLNTCIAIRTLLHKGDKVYFQAGAGIVHDSDAESEYKECINKAKVINSAIDLAEGGFTS
tara:strand:- start:1435 stop:2694 length:1260 start_codon:yes stop_codon:yes gene_type:complete